MQNNANLADARDFAGYDGRLKTPMTRILPVKFSALELSSEALLSHRLCRVENKLVNGRNGKIVGRYLECQTNSRALYRPQLQASTTWPKPLYLIPHSLNRLSHFQCFVFPFQIHIAMWLYSPKRRLLNYVLLIAKHQNRSQSKMYEFNAMSYLHRVDSLGVAHDNRLYCRRDVCSGSCPKMR